MHVWQFVLKEAHALLQRCFPLLQKDDDVQPEDHDSQSQSRHPQQRRGIFCTQKAFVAIGAVVTIDEAVVIGAQVAICAF